MLIYTIWLNLHVTSRHLNCNFCMKAATAEPVTVSAFSLSLSAINFLISQSRLEIVELSNTEPLVDKFRMRKVSARLHNRCLLLLISCPVSFPALLDKIKVHKLYIDVLRSYIYFR